VVGYAAAHLGRWHVDRGLLLRCLALYTIFNAVVNLVTRQGIWDKARGTCPPSANLCRALECLGTCGRLAVQLISAPASDSCWVTMSGVSLHVAGHIGLDDANVLAGDSSVLQSRGQLASAVHVTPCCLKHARRARAR